MKEPFGKPGLPPNWSSASKHGIGTACSDTSKVWFTIANGILTEVFYPTVDVANTRDMQFLVTDGATFFDEEKADCAHAIEYIDPKALAYRVTNTAKNGKYRIIKHIAADTGSNSVVTRGAFEVLKGSDCRLFLLFAPHIKNMGANNSGRVFSFKGRDFLSACREDIACAVTSDAPFKKMSCGYSGHSDGWQDLKENLKMDWTFEAAGEGNIALTAEIDLTKGNQFEIYLSFGTSETDAVAEALQALERGYGAIEAEYIKGWRRYLSGLRDLSGMGLDGGKLYWTSAMVLKAHEDKTHKGVIASLSIPWGEARGDGESGGYHLIWSRDMVNSALGFLAMGDTEASKRILKYLMRTQKTDGSWPQNMWLNGAPYWHGVQLDEVAFPILLAWRLRKMGLVKDEPYLMVKKAAAFILKEGPVTEQDRWEENSGFSPFTLAVEVAALVCAGRWALEAGEAKEARYILDTADYWAGKIEEWTFSECDCISAEDTGHFLRIVSNPPEALPHGKDLCHAEVFMKNVDKEAPHHQGQIIDAGFLELVRLGVLDPEDTHITRSLKLVDSMLKRDFGYGPLFYRYNNDGFGEKADGSPFNGTGIGRLWPLLSGERGIYELMAGSSADPYIRAMEGSANDGRLIPEQVWDSGGIPDKGLWKGKGTQAATPLVWAHSEYIKLLRTKNDERGCDLIDEVYERYRGSHHATNLTSWKINKPIRYALSTSVLRIVAHEPATLVWSADGWKTKENSSLISTGMGLYYINFMPDTFAPQVRLSFTFLYADNRWEGTNYEINIV